MADVAFEVKQDALAVIQNTVIEANFDECKAALTEMMKPYQSMIVTEDGIAAAKNDRARIRKVAGGIDEMRRTVKRAYSEPLKAFEDKCRELIAICDDGASNLDRQVKAFEDAEAGAKIERIRAHYDASPFAEEKEYIPWSALFNPKWGNKGYSEDGAKEEIDAALDRARADIAVIRTMDAQDVPYLLDIYKQTRDLGKVVVKQNQLKEAREREEKRKAELEQKRLAQIEEGQEQNRKDAERSETVYVPSAQSEQEEAQEVVFKVWATERQLMSLKGFLRANGIKYGRP